MPESDTAPTLDDETTAALTLFNEYVEADRERTQREKRIKKAERAKDEAAAVVKKLNERGSAEEKAEAEAAYRQAADRWKKLRDGEEPDEPVAESVETDPAEAVDEPIADLAAEPETADADPVEADAAETADADPVEADAAETVDQPVADAAVEPEADRADSDPAEATDLAEEEPSPSAAADEEE